MAGSLNRVMLIGNLGADPEIRSIQSGDKVANFRIATSESWRDKNSGERKEKSEWHNIVVWNDGLVKVTEQYLKKGMKVYVEGQLQTRKWEKDGVDRFTTEIVLQKFRGEIQMLDSKKDGDGGSRQSSGGSSSGGGDYGQQSGGERRQETKPDYGRDLSDEIPF